MRQLCALSTHLYLGSLNYSLLAKITECLDEEAHCLPATQFTWREGAENEALFTNTEDVVDSVQSAANYQNQQYH